MTRLDTIRDLLTNALLFRRFDKVHEALSETSRATPETEMAYRICEDVRQVQKQLGPSAQLAVEFTAADGMIGIAYSVGFGSKHAHTFDVHGRGTTLQEAIDAALKHPR